MLTSERPDRIQVAFDDHRLVSNAGLMLPVTLTHRLGLGQLVDSHLDLGDAPGRANAGDKILTQVASAPVGGNCIDDTDALRSGSTGRVLGCAVKASSTWGPSCAVSAGVRCDNSSGQVGNCCLVPGTLGRNRRLASDDQHVLHRLRDIRAGRGGSPPSQLHWPAWLSSAAGRCSRNRRRDDGTVAQGARHRRHRRGTLPA